MPPKIDNGVKTKIICSLITILIGIFGVVVSYNYFIVVPALADNIITNDVRNRLERAQIRAEMIQRDEKMWESIHRFDVRQEVLIKAVERIEKKI